MDRRKLMAATAGVLAAGAASTGGTAAASEGKEVCEAGCTDCRRWHYWWRSPRPPAVPSRAPDLRPPSAAVAMRAGRGPKEISDFLMIPLRTVKRVQSNTKSSA